MFVGGDAVLEESEVDPVGEHSRQWMRARAQVGVELVGKTGRFGVYTRGQKQTAVVTAIKSMGTYSVAVYII